MAAEVNPGLSIQSTFVIKDYIQGTGGGKFLFSGGSIFTNDVFWPNSGLGSLTYVYNGQTIWSALASAGNRYAYFDTTGKLCAGNAYP